MSELSPDETVTPDISRKYQIPISQERIRRYQNQNQVFQDSPNFQLPLLTVVSSSEFKT